MHDKQKPPSFGDTDGNLEPPPKKVIVEPAPQFAISSDTSYIAHALCPEDRKRIDTLTDAMNRLADALAPTQRDGNLEPPPKVIETPATG